MVLLKRDSAVLGLLPLARDLSQRLRGERLRVSVWAEYLVSDALIVAPALLRLDARPNEQQELHCRAHARAWGAREKRNVRPAGTHRARRQ
eukprot:4861625-Prymnesium_polylepis.1